jgi:heme/copper-type cytochrome/quinol oxidase subunit 2
MKEFRMKKTITCECGKEYSVEAKNCPNCGKVNPFGKKVALIATLIAIPIIIIIGIFVAKFAITYATNQTMETLEQHGLLE